MNEVPDSVNRLPPTMVALLHLKRAHWNKAVYLITEVLEPGSEEGGQDGRLRAINLTRDMAAEDQDPPG